MKKVLAIIMALVMMVPFASVAFAADTTLTTTVPEAAYTLNIPADQTIKFGATTTEIGVPTVTDTSGFADGKNLKVTLTYAPFSSTTTDSTIPFTIKFNDSDRGEYEYIYSSNSLTFLGYSNGTTSELPCYKYNYSMLNYDKCFINIESRTWGRALAGDYKATITYTAEVVVAK